MVKMLQFDRYRIGPGTFTTRIQSNENRRVVVSSVGENLFRIVSQNDEPYSFEIGYDDWSMTLVTFEHVPIAEQQVFGQYQLSINNNWRITNGLPQRVLNIRISQLQLHANRDRPLFQIQLDRNVPEPQEVCVKIATSPTGEGEFATMFFASNQLLHIRFDADSGELRNIYDQIQRIYVPDPMDWALELPRRVNRNPEFWRQFQQFEDVRQRALRAPPQRSQLFRRIVALGILNLRSPDNPDLAVAEIIENFHDYVFLNIDGQPVAASQPSCRHKLTKMILIDKTKMILI